MSQEFAGRGQKALRAFPALLGKNSETLPDSLIDFDYGMSEVFIEPTPDAADAVLQENAKSTARGIGRLNLFVSPRASANVCVHNQKVGG